MRASGLLGLQGCLRDRYQRWGMLLFGALALPAHGADPATNSPLQSLGGDVFQIGSVVFDKSAKTVRIPATMNLNSGLIEYFLVRTMIGKVYESLLATSAQPYHIQLAKRLAGAKGVARGQLYRRALQACRFYVNQPAGVSPLGDPISIGLTWTTGGKTHHLSAADAL